MVQVVSKKDQLVMSFHEGIRPIGDTGIIFVTIEWNYENSKTDFEYKYLCICYNL